MLSPVNDIFIHFQVKEPWIPLKQNHEVHTGLLNQNEYVRPYLEPQTRNSSVLLRNKYDSILRGFKSLISFSLPAFPSVFVVGKAKEKTKQNKHSFVITQAYADDIFNTKLSMSINKFNAVSNIQPSNKNRLYSSVFVSPKSILSSHEDVLMS